MEKAIAMEDQAFEDDCKGSCISGDDLRFVEDGRKDSACD